MNTTGKKAFIPTALVFIILTALIISGKTFLQSRGFDIEFLLYANGFLFVLSIGAYILQHRGLQSANPEVFVRSVYASMMFKMFITMVAVLIYVVMLRDKINKPGLFTAMGMYVVYTVVEVSGLTKVLKSKKNA